MVVASAAIESYLSRLPVPVPSFKGMDEKRLLRSIYDSTGQFFESKTEILPHQLEGIAFALYQRCALLFYAPRMRKTSIALNWAEHLQRARLWKNKGLVIAHSPDGLPVWESETALRSNLKIRVVHLDQADFTGALEDDSDLIVIPWSGLQEMFNVKGKNRKGENKLYADKNLLEAVSAEFGLCIIDEIHMCMHHQSLRFAIASILTAQCKFRLGLTGTPFGRDPYALWSQAFLIDRGVTLGHNYYFFEQAFSDKPRRGFTGKPVYKFDKDKLPALKTKMSSLCMFYDRSEVEDQTVLSSVIELYMWGDQLQAYREVVDRLVRLEHGDVQILSTFHRLRQVSSGYLPFTDDEGVEHTLEFRRNPKLEWLEDFVKTAPAEVQVIIFHDYIYTGELICKVLRKHSIAYGWLYGQTRNSRSVIKDFQEQRTHMLVANAAKGGMSIDLRMADYVLYFESPVSPITRKQSQDRPMARGARPVTIDDLVCSSVEQRILEFHKDGKELISALSSVRVRKSLQ